MMTDEDIQTILSKMVEGDMNWHSVADRGRLRFSERTAIREVIERLAEVERLRTLVAVMQTDGIDLLIEDGQRLRAQNAALREIAQAVAGTEAREITLVSPDDESYRDVGLFHETVNVLYIRDKAIALLAGLAARP